jgi:hypothetical protein
MAAGARGVVTVLRDEEVEVDIGEQKDGSRKNTTAFKIPLLGTVYKQIMSEDSEECLKSLFTTNGGPFSSAISVLADKTRSDVRARLTPRVSPGRSAPDSSCAFNSEGSHRPQDRATRNAAPYGPVRKHL